MIASSLAIALVIGAAASEEPPTPPASPTPLIEPGHGYRDKGIFELGAGASAVPVPPLPIGPNLYGSLRFGWLMLRVDVDLVGDVTWLLGRGIIGGAGGGFTFAAVSPALIPRLPLQAFAGVGPYAAAIASTATDSPPGFHPVTPVFGVTGALGVMLEFPLVTLSALVRVPVLAREPRIETVAPVPLIGADIAFRLD